MRVGPDSVSVQSNFMQLDTQDFPGCRHQTTKSSVCLFHCFTVFLLTVWVMKDYMRIKIFRMIELFLLNASYKIEIISRKIHHPRLVIACPVLSDERLRKSAIKKVVLHPYLVEHRRPILMFVEAGNILTNTAACGLVLWRDVDLILKCRH